MTNFVLITLALYILYYAGNIVYDLFIAKEKKLVTEEDKEEFSLENLADADDVNVTQVDLDSVEEITSSNSIEIDENEIFNNDEEIEENVISVYNPNNSSEIEENKTFFENVPTVENTKEHIREVQRKRFRDILNQAETNVQVVLNAEGEKMYRSTIPNM